MLIGIVCPGPTRLTLTEESITSDGYTRHESSSSVTFHQGQKKLIVW